MLLLPLLQIVPQVTTVKSEHQEHQIRNSVQSVHSIQILALELHQIAYPVLQERNVQLVLMDQHLLIAKQDSTVLKELVMTL